MNGSFINYLAWYKEYIYQELLIQINFNKLFTPVFILFGDEDFMCAHQSDNRQGKAGCFKKYCHIIPSIYQRSKLART